MYKFTRYANMRAANGRENAFAKGFTPSVHKIRGIKNIRPYAGGYKQHHMFLSLSMLTSSLLKVSSFPSSAAISVAPPGVTATPDIATRTGQSS